ncbi:unnamed protein product [Sphenostylis stenocarpa]|uniref:Uncharacterized protein n=1 Tax=Sphenostylis stenocarpa TaxID=92480 RepID=A0AA86T7X9_9FABA|nr:unnamed protein product [Sphenostylis stenocarpa]
MKLSAQKVRIGIQWESTVSGSYSPPSVAASPSKPLPKKLSPLIILKPYYFCSLSPPASTKRSSSFISPNCRCEHMDGAVYESHARREGRNVSERPFAGLLPLHLQAYVPPHQAGLCLRRWNPCPQASHCRRPPPPARKRLS